MTEDFLQYGTQHGFGLGGRRIFGLDVLRATAVTLVVFGHMLQHAHAPAFIRYFGRLGILGVEIFFVLSGFLIGGIILNLIRKKQFETPADITRFWSRRWLRTLPLYYLFFAIYLRYDWTGPSRLSDHLEFLVFLQNFAWRGPDFFLLSWSLTIEEYFYFFFPLLYGLLHRGTRNPVRSMWGAIGVFLTVPLLLKLGRAPYPDWDGFNFQIRMVTVTRLDSLMYGVAAAFLKEYYPRAWAFLRKLTPLSAVFAFLMATYIYFDIRGLLGSRLIQTFLFPVMSLSVALLLPAFDSLRGPVRSLGARAVAYVSLISYSIYLGHILIITLVNRLLNSRPQWTTRILFHPTRVFPIYLTLTLLLASLTYYGWERPFIRFRDRQRRRAALGIKASPVTQASSP